MVTSFHHLDLTLSISFMGFSFSTAKKKPACVNVFLNPCSPEENNGNNYRETEEHRSGKTYCPDGTTGSFLTEVKRWLISNIGTIGTK